MEILVTAELIGLLITICTFFIKVGKVKEKFSNMQERIEVIEEELNRVVLNLLKDKLE